MTTTVVLRAVLPDFYETPDKRYGVLKLKTKGWRVIRRVAGPDGTEHQTLADVETMAQVGDVITADGGVAPEPTNTVH